MVAQGYASSKALNNQVGDGSSLVTGVSIETKAPVLIDASVQHLYRALNVKPANMVVGVSGTLPPEPCPGGDTITVTYNFADVNTLSNGDTLTITSNNCVEDQLKINGGPRITFSDLTGTPSPTSAWGATMAMTFINFAVTENNVTETANGDMTITFNQTSTGTDNFTACGNSLQLSTTTANGTVTRTISAYSYSGSATLTGLYTYGTNLTVSGDMPRLGSNVLYTVKTITNFKQQ